MDRDRFKDALLLLSTACWLLYDEEAATLEQQIPKSSIWECERLLIFRIKKLPDEKIPPPTGSRVGDAFAICDLVAKENLREGYEWLRENLETAATTFAEDGPSLSLRTLLEQSQKAVWILLDHYRDMTRPPGQIITDEHPLNEPINYTAFSIELDSILLPDRASRFEAFEVVFSAVEEHSFEHVGKLRKLEDFQWQADYAVISVLLQERRARDMFEKTRAEIRSQMTAQKTEGFVVDEMSVRLHQTALTQIALLRWEDQAHLEYVMRRSGELDPAFRCDNREDAKRLFMATLKRKVQDMTGASDGDLASWQRAFL